MTFEEWSIEYYRTVGLPWKDGFAEATWNRQQEKIDQLSKLLDAVVTTSQGIYARELAVEGGTYIAVTPSSWEAHMNAIKQLQTLDKELEA